MQIVWEVQKPVALKQRLLCYYNCLMKNAKAITQ